MNIRIEPSRAWGKVAAPTSKSMAHRMMIAASLAEGKSNLYGLSFNEDIAATLDCLLARGAFYEYDDGCLSLFGTHKTPKEGCIYPCRESGSTLRFLLPLSLLGRTAVFTGSERLFARGVGVYEELFRENATFLHTKDTLTVKGELKPGHYTLPGNVSSQFVSGLLFALPLLKEESSLTVLPPVESRPYMDMTVAVLRLFGIEIETKENFFRIPGGQIYRPLCLPVEGDWSGGAALLGFNAVGGEVEVSGLMPDSLQGDRVFPTLLARLKKPDAAIDIADCPDLGPELFAVAACLGNGAIFTGTGRLRIKESDRAAVMAEELAKCGIRLDVEENRVKVYPGCLQKPALPLSGHNDHRIVMALCLPLSLVGGEIEGAEAVKKSFPDFFDTLRALHVEVTDDT